MLVIIYTDMEKWKLFLKETTQEQKNRTSK